MNTKHNELQEVNEYIKEYNLRPYTTEKLSGSLYNEIDDMTYLVVGFDDTYISYSSYRVALFHVLFDGGLLVACRGKINE